MKNTIILILILLSFLQSNLFGQKDTFDNDKYFKLIKHYQQSKQEPIADGFTEFEIYSMSDTETNSITNRYPKFKNYLFQISPNKKYLFGYKYIGIEANVDLVSICFLDTNGVLYNEYKLDGKCESFNHQYYTGNSEYLYLLLRYYKHNDVLIFDKLGNKIKKIENFSNTYVNRPYFSNDMKYYLLQNEEKKENFAKLKEAISYYNINGKKLWSQKIGDISNPRNAYIYNNIIVIYGNMISVESKLKNNYRKVVILNKINGNILYEKDNIEKVFFSNAKFLISKKINNDIEYFEYEVFN